VTCGVNKCWVLPKRNFSKNLVRNANNIIAGGANKQKMATPKRDLGRSAVTHAGITIDSDKTKIFDYIRN